MRVTKKLLGGDWLTLAELLDALSIVPAHKTRVVTEIAARGLPYELQVSYDRPVRYALRSRAGFVTLLHWVEQFHDGTPEGVEWRLRENERLAALEVRLLLGGL